MKQNIVFFGSGSYTIPVVEKLIKHGLSLVITTEKAGELIDFCNKNKIDVVSARTAKELTAISYKLSAHSLGILASFGAIIPDEIINYFSHGIINIHPSLLPRWKGPSPIQYTLLNGDTQTGVTIIKLDNEIDHGNILIQTEYRLTGDETTQFLLDKLFSIGADLVEDLIVKIEDGEKIIETPQNHSKETWSYKITKEDGEIHLNKIPTTKLEIRNFKLEIGRRVRAYYPWPTVWFRTNLKGQQKLIKLLPEKRLQVEGKNPMNYKDFINGYGEEGKEMLVKLSLI